MKVFVDTSALLAILDADDVHHAEAAATFRSLVGETELVTHNYIHVEAGALVQRRLGAAAFEVLTDRLLPAMTTVWVDEEVHRAAVDARRGRSGGPSLVDEVSFVVMRRAGIDLAFAFDADFDAQGFRRASPRSDVPQDRLSEQHAPYGIRAPVDDAPAPEPEPSELVSVAEISSRSGRPANTIQSWRRRHRDFPAPIANLAAGPVWHWPDVAQWMATRRSRGLAASGSGRR